MEFPTKPYIYFTLGDNLGSPQPAATLESWRQHYNNALQERETPKAILRLTS